MTNPRTILDAEIRTALKRAVHGREDAHEHGLKLVSLFESRCQAEVAIHGDDALIPAAAWTALDLGNAYLKA